MLKHILVPLDGSHLAEKAVDYAREIVQPNGKITLLTALEVPDYPVYGYYPASIGMDEADYQTMVKNLTPNARDYLEKIAVLLRKDGFEVDNHALVGEPATLIVETAQNLNVDAIIMSTHGRSGFSRWLFGSVTNKVLSATPCPVFVIPGEKLAKITVVEPEATIPVA